MDVRAKQFLEKYGMDYESIIPAEAAVIMCKDMEQGLAGKSSSMPMIPTYISNAGEIPQRKSAIVIDAGGTNFRCGLLSFENGTYELRDIKKSKMPGIEKPASWEEFISFVAENIMPLTDRADKIGFCFSYSADITPKIDGRVITIDKEVSIKGCEGQLVGASLLAELEKRGVYGKSIVILNDTVAVLLGGASLLDKTGYGGFAGQVSGTGTNTCCELPIERVSKLNLNGNKSIIINLESGMYDGIKGGFFDEILDKESMQPGKKIFEKLTSGVYLGELCRIMFKAAAEEDIFSSECAAKMKALGRIDSAVIDAWSCGENMNDVSANQADAEFIKDICCAMFERSARCMCTNLLAMMLLTGAAANAEKPYCICAEGSLVQKGRYYRPALEKLLQRESGKLGLYAALKIGEGSTMPGSAAAALLNA